MDSPVAPIFALDRADLTAPVRRALARPVLEVVDWTCRPIHAPINQATGGVYRVSGTASDQGRTVSWSLILKVVQAAAGFSGANVDPASANYWRREPQIYQSGLLDQLPGLRAPRLWGLVERGDACTWLWLEDVADPVGSCWPLERYGVAARQLGRFNGAFLAPGALPAAAGLSRGWSRAWTAGWAPLLAQLPQMRDHPLVRRCWPGDLPDRLLRLGAEADALFDALDGLPQTFCHLDAFSRNLLMRPRPDGGEEMVAIDWAFAGIAPLGADLAPLVAASVAYFDADVAQLRAIEELAFAGYVEGLRAAGWRGDPRLVRFGSAVAAALRYALLPVGVLVTDERRATALEIAFGHPIGDLLDNRALLGAFLLDQVDAARADFPLAAEGALV